MHKTAIMVRGTTMALKRVHGTSTALKRVRGIATTWYNSTPMNRASFVAFNFVRVPNWRVMFSWKKLAAAGQIDLYSGNTSIDIVVFYCDKYPIVAPRDGTFGLIRSSPQVWKGLGYAYVSKWGVSWEIQQWNWHFATWNSVDTCGNDLLWWLLDWVC